MTDNVENLVLEHLRAIRATLADHGQMLMEHGVRRTEISTAVAGLRPDQAHDAEASAIWPRVSTASATMSSVSSAAWT